MFGTARHTSIATCLLACAGQLAFGGTFDAWAYKARIRTAGYTGGGTLTNFPMLVELGTNTIANLDYSTFTSPEDGGDLRFSASNGVDELSYEIERWDTTGVSTVWVQVPRVEDTSTVIWAFWGLAGTSAPEYTTNGSTWTNGYAGVWHLAETPGEDAAALDSTTNANHGAFQGSMTGDDQVPGRAGGALDFDGSDDALLIGNTASLQISGDQTIEFWLKPPVLGGRRNPWNKAYGGEGTITVEANGTVNYFYGTSGANASPYQAFLLNSPIAAADWTHLTIVRDLVSRRLTWYKNGSSSVSGAGNYASATVSSLDAIIGDGYAGNSYGLLDEIRVSSVTRSPEWVEACWLNQASNHAFCAYEPAEIQATSLAVRVSAPSDLGKDRATLNGMVTHTGDAENPDVYFCWDTSERGVTATGDWANVISMGTNWAKGDSFSTNVVGLLSGSNYTYRCYVTNSTGAAWSDQAVTFTTVYLPAVTNLGATNVYGVTATLLGEVTDTGGESPAVWFQYWEVDGSATSLVEVGRQSGAFSATVGAWPHTAYFFRILASNDAGTVWSELGAFGTRKPYFVSTNGSHTLPYDTWDKAATNIQSAVDAATNDFDVVLVTNGVYAGETTVAGEAAVTISRSIVLMSLNGPEHTIIRPVRSYRRGIDITAAATNAEVRGFTINDANMPSHTAPYYGAGIRMYNGTVTNCVIDDCYTRGRGGGIWMSGGRVANCTLSRNHCDEWQYGYGGAIFMEGAGCVVESCIITDNYTLSRRGGGGIWMNAGTVRNCLFAGNEGRRNDTGSESLGGAVNLSGSGRLEHCTLVGNYSGGPGGGLYMTGGSVENCIAYDNTVQATISEDYRNVYPGGGSFTYSCAAPLQSGTGNTHLSPEFTDANSDDYTLGVGSSAIDSGSDLGVAGDLAGNMRPLDGDGVNGPGYDMGCYEAPSASERPFTCSFVADETIGLNSLTVRFTASVAGADTNVQHFWWDFNRNGAPSMTTNGANLWVVENTYGVGYYSVSLTVSNASGQVTNSVRDTYIKVAPSILYVSPDGSHTAPFASWADAANDIQAAVDAAYAPSGSGVEVRVAAASYSLSEQVNILKPLAVCSTGGPSLTVTRPAASQVRNFTVQNEEALLEGFTLTGANITDLTTHGGGVYLTAGTVSNCYIIGNTVRPQGGGVYLSGGLVTDCVISNNRSYEWQYGYGGGVRMLGGRVERCRIAHNVLESKQGGGGVSMSGGILRNCLIATNRCTRTTADSPGIGGGVRLYSGTIENCTIVDNYSFASGGGLYITAGTVTNSIVYFNTVSSGYPYGTRNVYQTGGTIDFSCTDPLIAGNNTSLDPEFTGRPTNYQLQAVSPCIDSGTNLAWMTGAIDLAGSNRVINGTGDMGCYEAPEPGAGPLVVNFSAPVVTGFKSLEVTFTATASGSDTNVTWFEWDYDNDGTPDAAGAGLWVVTYTFPEGYHDVSLSASNASGESAHVAKSSYVMVAPRVAYVATNGAGVPPYMSWADAAVSVQDAVNAGGYDATDQTLVRVAAGVYGSGVQVGVAKPITVRGDAGASQTFLEATGNERVLNLSDSRIVIDGLTIMGADNGLHTYDGGGVYMTAGLVTNCHILDNRVGGRGGGVFLGGGLVTDCTFTSNRCTEWQYGYGGGAYIHNTGNGMIRNCVFDGNWTESHRGGGALYLNGGTARNCLIARNSATRTQVGAEGDGGGVAMERGLLESCTIARNSAVKDGGGLQMIGNYGWVTNCIVYYNEAATGAQDIHNPVRIGYSCSPDLTHETAGNITNAPMFVNTNAANYELADESPCVEAGLNRDWMLDSRDLLGSTRILRLNVDMGAYENIPPYGTVIIVR